MKISEVFIVVGSIVFLLLGISYAWHRIAQLITYTPDGAADVRFCRDYCNDGESILIEFRSTGINQYPTCICTTADVE